MSNYYEFSVFPKWLKDELTEREAAFDVNKDWRKSRTTWMRFISNAISDGKNGFNMPGGKAFDDTYGFGVNTPNTILGYDLNGTPHVLDETVWQHRPPPGVVSISIENQGSGSAGSGGGFLMEAKIKWKCWSADQIDYLTPYFLTPGITAIIQFGWDNCPIPPIDVSDSNLQVKITDESQLNDTLGLDSFGLGDFWGGKSAEKAYKKMYEASKGRMGMVFGFISDFEFSINETGGYDCETKIAMMGEIANYLSVDKPNGKNEEGKPKISLKQWMETFYNKIVERPSYLTEWFSKDMNDVGSPIEGLSDKEIIIKGKTVDISPKEKSVFWKRQVFSFKTFYANLSEDLKSSQSDYEAVNENKSYVRFPVVVDIINSFFADDNFDDKTKPQVFYINIKDIRISAHPNIKPVNYDIFIPNQKAHTGKSYNNFSGSKYYGFFGNAASDLAEANEVLAKNYVGVAASSETSLPPERVDLFYYILKNGLPNKGEISEKDPIEPFRSFPNYDEAVSTEEYGYWGYLSDIYIDTSLVYKAFTENETIKDALDHLLNAVSSASNNLWNLRLVPMNVHSNGEMTIIDANYKGLTPVSEFLESTNPENSMYEFKFGTYKSILKSLSFKLDSGGAVATQTIAKNYEEPDKDKSEIVNGNKDKKMNFVRKDRIFKVYKQLAEIKKSKMTDTNSTTSEKEEVTDPQAVEVEKTDHMIFKFKNGEDGYYLVRAIEPDISLQNLVMSDDTPFNNARHNTPIVGVEATIQILGVTGFKPADLVKITGIPKIINSQGVFSIKSFSHEISDAGWFTGMDLIYTPSNKKESSSKETTPSSQTPQLPASAGNATAPATS